MSHNSRAKPAVKAGHQLSCSNCRQTFTSAHRQQQKCYACQPSNARRQCIVYGCPVMLDVNYRHDMCKTCWMKQCGKRACKTPLCQLTVRLNSDSEYCNRCKPSDDPMDRTTSAHSTIRSSHPHAPFPLAPQRTHQWRSVAVNVVSPPESSDLSAIAYSTYRQVIPTPTSNATTMRPTTTLAEAATDAAAIAAVAAASTTAEASLQTVPSTKKPCRNYSKCNRLLASSAKTSECLMCYAKRTGIKPCTTPGCPHAIPIESSATTHCIECHRQLLS